ncbi:peroxisomal membrane protein PMP22-like [Melia azedarach]|uniref:Peroxisomal membrane protein PMP22-like n=1 Tax=Melia azedarach TaxID=155640 RepID=A0ACC1YGU9_MELAZ|nr:peroxisomal membrane protein PMP22-like [Melia azedarach]
MSDLAKEAWRKYLIQLQAHPLRTKAITAGVLAGVNDAVAQKIVGVKKLQVKRLLLLMLFSFAYGGPFGHFLHKFMDIIFKGKRDKKTVAKRVLLEQLTTSPWNNFFFMMYYGLVVEGRSWSLVKNKVRKDYPSVQLTAWRFWPIVGWVNYHYIPLQFRVLFSSLIVSCWSIFLKLKAGSVAIKKE